MIEVRFMKMKILDELKIKIFADGADLNGMLEMRKNPLISGFTTNPSLMRKAGITDYHAFAKEILSHITEHPVSFEVFADELLEMERQARVIATWGGNVNVKIPVTNTRGESTAEVISRLSADGVSLNVTALTTLEQVAIVRDALSPKSDAIVSVFAGRIADTGRDPASIMRDASRLLEDRPGANLLWASTRELFNVFQAEEAGCHIITVTNDIIAKLSLVGRDLVEYSLDTVKMFYKDAKESGYSI